MHHCRAFVDPHNFCISSHPLLMLLEPEPLFLTNSLRMPCEVRRSVDDGVSAFQLQRFSTPWSSELRDALRGHDRASLEIHLEAVIERVWRCTGRPWQSGVGDALGGRDRAIVQMHLEAKIERVWRCIWRPRSTEFGDAIGGRDRVTLEMHLEAAINPGWRCTWRPWSSEFQGALGGRNQARLEEY